MSTIGPACSEIDRISSSAMRPLLVWRWTWMGGLLAAEMLALSIRFDAVAESSPLAQTFGWTAWTGVVGHLGIAVVAALLLLRGHLLPDSLRQIAYRFDSTRFPWLSLLAHLITMAGFYRLTAVVFEGGFEATDHAAVWVVAWALTGLLSVGCWISAAVSVAVIPALARGSIRWLVPGFCVAVAALVAGRLTDQLWRPLANSTFLIVEQLIGLVYPDVVSQPQELILGTPSFSVQIARMCSGYEGIGLVLVFLGIFLLVYRRELRFPQSLLLLPVGLIVIWLANALRIAILIAIGTSVSPAVALGGFHSQAGWLSFNAVTLGLIAVAWNSPFFAKTATRSNAPARPTEYPAAPYLVPFLVLIATVMLTGAISSGGFDRLYPFRVLATAAALGYFLRTYRREQILHWNWSWHAAAIGAAVFGIWMALEPLSGVEDSAGGEQAAGLAGMSLTMAAVWILFRAIGSVVTVPLAEELAFRGFLTRRLIVENFDRLPMGQFTWFSFVVSSALFGLMHGRWLAGTIVGLLFALAFYRRGRLMDAVVAHATANGLITGYVLATGNWAAWS